jgi:hypothetical protein
LPFSSLRSIVIPRSIELLCSSCFLSCGSLSSITFESDSSVKRIEAHAFQHTSLRLVMIPPTVCHMACDAFQGDCHISVLIRDSSVELKQWCAEHDRDSTVDFRRILRLSSGLPCLSECFLDLSVFERCHSLGVAHQGQCSLYRRKFCSRAGRRTHSRLGMAIAIRCVKGSCFDMPAVVLKSLIIGRS